MDTPRGKTKKERGGELEEIPKVKLGLIVENGDLENR